MFSTLSMAINTIFFWAICLIKKKYFDSIGQKSETKSNMTHKFLSIWYREGAFNGLVVLHRWQRTLGLTRATWAFVLIPPHLVYSGGPDVLQTTGSEFGPTNRNQVESSSFPLLCPFFWRFLTSSLWPSLLSRKLFGLLFHTVVGSFCCIQTL